MAKYIHLFETEGEFNSARENDYKEPWVSYTEENTKVNYNKGPLETPLTFEITGGGNIYWKAKSGTPASGLRGLEYKKNDGTWTSVTSSTGGVTIPVASGDTVMFRAPEGVTYSTLSDTYEKANFFSGCTCAFNVKGNVMSLLDANNFYAMTSLTAPLVFTCLFWYCTGLTDASELILPADNLTVECYREMFAKCSNLVGVPKLPAMNLGEGCYNGMFRECYKLTDGTMLPELPATTLAERCYDFMFASDTGLTDASELVLPAITLANSCYNSMFWKCTSLRTAPELPATTLANSCYYQMFQGCTSLTQAPELPVTALTDHCYYQMFQGCTSLTQAPELPATTLANNCYELMFSDCTSLTTAPELPATTLAERCYGNMFNGCTNLNYIKCLATDISANGCTKYWVGNVAASGTFVKTASMTSWSTGSISGIPTGWTVQDAS